MGKPKNTLSTAALAAFLLLLLWGDALSQEQETKEVTDEELRELLGMTIEAASKKEELVSKAPGAVSVLTADEIKELGIQSVADAVGFMTGVFLYDSYFGNYNQLAIRGNFGAEHYNTKILFMVNGHPIYYAVHGGFEINSIPIEAVGRIEVVRGPVSVMYGTNALTGVINIITKKEPDFLNGEIRYRYGSFDTHELRLSLGKNFQDFRFFLSGTYRHQDGYDLVLKPDQDEAERGCTHKQKYNFENLFFNMNYKDLEVDVAHWNQQHPSKIGIIPNSSFPCEIFDQSFLYADVRYAPTISENASLTFKVRLDTLDYYWEPQGINLIDRTAANPSIAQAENWKYGVEVYADVAVHKNLNMLSGVMYDSYHSSPYTFSSWFDPTGADFSPYKEEKSTSDLAAYANFDLKVSEPISMVGGFRHTDNSITGGHTDYRIGSIIMLKENLALKALYGTSYRSPNFFELFVTSPPILMGNENLDFEILNGIDIGLYYSYKDSGIASLKYFWNRTDNFITRRLVGGIPTYVNIEGHEAHGIEYELKYTASRQFSLFFNGMNILDSKDLEIDDGMRYIVKHMLNFGCTYRPTEPLILSYSNIYRGAWADSDSYFVSNIAMYYKLPGYHPRTELFVTVNNLFDKEYTYSEFSRRLLETIPGGPPRSVSAGIILSF